MAKIAGTDYRGGGPQHTADTLPSRAEDTPPIAVARMKMQASVAELLHDWHDFYLLVGTASATLVGLMFVAASIGTQVFDPTHAPGFRAFISPTVMHFTATLIICVLVTIPAHSRLPLAALLAIGGLVGSAYTGWLLAQIVVRRRFQVDAVDRVFYGGMPAVGYLMVLVAGLMLLDQSEIAPDVLAVAILALLLTAIRNAWDMMMWIVIRTPGGQPATAATATDNARAPGGADDAG
jgi:hypothetical protein